MTQPPDDDSWRDEIYEDPDEPPARPIVVRADFETRPDLLCETAVHLVTERMITTLRADAEIFVAAGSLVHVIRADAPVEGSHHAVEADTPIIRTAPASWVGDRVSLLARCVRRVHGKKGPETKPVPPPSDRVRAVIERGHWPGYRPLIGVLEAPSMRPDGSIIQTRGYDAATGYLYDPNATFDPVPDKPTHSDAVAAFSRLADPFRDFPYVDASHLSAVLSAILTLVARPAIRGPVPCWFFDATKSRSGKTLQVDVVSIIATGRPAGRQNYPEDDDELSKIIGGYAQAGARVVYFDNVKREFGSSILDMAITCEGTIQVRILGATGQPSYPWRAVIFASGNNFDARGDILGRILAPRLETPLDNPELRSDVTYPDLRAHVKAHRTELVAAALTILRAYVVAGKPEQAVTKWGGFDAWTRLVAHALVWVGAESPLGARRGLENDDDPLRAAQAGLVSGWARMLRRQSLLEASAKEALAILYPPRSRHEEHEPDPIGDELRDAIESLTRAKAGAIPTARALGDALRRLKGTPVQGRRLFANVDRNGVAKWRVTEPKPTDR